MRGSMAGYTSICGTVYLLASLVTLATTLPVASQGQFPENNDDLQISARSLSEQEDSEDVLQAKKNILERLLKETDDEISDDKILKKRVGHAIVTRFTDHGPSADRPSKKSNSEPWLRTDKESSQRGQDSVNIEKLKMLLEALRQEQQYEVEKTTTPPAQSSLNILYKKLADLDIDLHKLLDSEQMSGLDKRQRDNGDYNDGRYPKGLIL